MEKAMTKNARSLSKKEERIPKKIRTSTKSCALCNKHGGAHTTHNTEICRRYKKDGTLRKGFNKMKMPSGSKPAGQNFAQIMKTEFSKLQKSMKKDKTCKKKRNTTMTAILLTTLEGLGKVVQGI